MNIELWKKHYTPTSLMLAAPDHVPIVVTGRVYGHHTLPDGSEIMVSNIAGWDFQEAAFIDSEGLQYRLKTPAKEYLIQFPKCLELIEKAIRARKFLLPSSVLNNLKTL